MNKTRTVISAGLAAALATAATAQVRSLTGAGATFPYPIYSKWFDAYHKKTGVRINYQSIGSGGGISQVAKKTVDFGASDGPMTDKQLYQVDGKLVHIPTVLGAVVPAFNLPGVKELKLTGPVLADIFLGKITSWSDPRIAELNAGTELPGSPIIVVHRSDGSGTTYCWVDYLCAVSPEWKKKVGVNTAVRWPTGLGGKGNEGVAGLIQNTPNSLGYVEAIYARQNDIPFAAVKNKAGEFVKASVEAVTEAAAGAAKSMPKDFRASIVDAAGKGVYPISTFTWLLVYEKNPAGKGEAIQAFLRWMLDEGQTLAPALGYAPLPDQVRGMVAKTIETIK